MRVAAIIESRMTSKRLPGKNLKPILGRPMVCRLIERLKLAKTLDAICLATSTDWSDQPLEEIAGREGIACFRGSLDDVLDRTLSAAKSVGADMIVEITGDCPLADPLILDAAVERHRRGDVDYLINVLDRLSFPIGFDVQVYPTALLDEVSRLTQDPYDRNNVTPYFYRNPDRYRILNLFAPPSLDRPQYRLCVDHPEDFEVVSAIYQALHSTDPGFSAFDIIRFLDQNPDLARRNTRREDSFAFPSSGGKARQEMMELDKEQ